MRVQGNEELRLAEQSHAGPETGRRRTGAEVWRERVGARVVARVVARARVQAAARTRARSWEMRCRRTLAALKAARLAGVAAEKREEVLGARVNYAEARLRSLQAHMDKVRVDCTIFLPCRRIRVCVAV